MSKPTLELTGEPVELSDIPYGGVSILHETHPYIKCRALWRNDLNSIISPIFGSIHMADKLHRFTPAKILIDGKRASWKWDSDTPIKKYQGLFLSGEKLSNGDLFVLKQQLSTYGEKQIYIKLEDRDLAVGMLNGLVIKLKEDVELLQVDLGWSFNDLE